MDTKRNYIFDKARALCAIWVVGLLHICTYNSLSYSGKAWVGNATLGVLPTFTFISGYFLGKMPMHNISDPLKFHKKRFIRI